MSVLSFVVIQIQDVTRESPFSPSCMRVRIKASKTDIHIGTDNRPLCCASYLHEAHTNLSWHKFPNLTIGYPLKLSTHTRQKINVSLYDIGTTFIKHYSTLIMSVISKLIETWLLKIFLNVKTLYFQCNKKDRLHLHV